MKSLVFIVLLALAAIAGYNFVNKPTEKSDTVVLEEIASTELNEASPNDNDAESEDVITDSSDDVSMITPADMSEEAQQAMYDSMVKYNKCMMEDRPQYHQENLKAEEVADQTLQECQPNLDALKAVLTSNNVNVDLREGMVKTVRQRTARKLMSAVMQAKAQMTPAESPVAVP